ncbi:S1 RNA-binding domain-containing protein [Streptomyces mutabilis]|uniref:S1 RNA-binding domain-containing protein n=1 Tax=Streptomyces mutabilis TaxID=67332 RepID=UPI00364B161E
MVAIGLAGGGLLREDDRAEPQLSPGAGFITIPELSWRRYETASDVVQVGQPVSCGFLRFDTTNGEARLSLRAMQPAPFRTFAESTAAGRMLRGRVTKLVPFGAFVQVAEDIEGLIHPQELFWTAVEAPEEMVRVDERITVIVTEIDTERRRPALSRRKALPRPRSEGVR